MTNKITLNELKKQLNESYGIRYRDADKAIDLIIDVANDLKMKANTDTLETIIPARLAAILEECVDDLIKACKYLGYDVTIP